MASAGRISTKCFWTSVNVVVTFSSISAVIPLNLHKKKVSQQGGNLYDWNWCEKLS